MHPIGTENGRKPSLKLGLGLLAAAPTQMAIGASILHTHPTRPINFLAALGMLLVIGSTLLLIGSIGELSAWMVDRLSQK